MSYRFVMGGSGSGKTTNIIKSCIDDSMVRPDHRYVFLIPEQYSLQIQREVVALHPDHATDSIDVLTFKRLAYKVFGELGVVNPEVIDDAGKAMILREVAIRCDDKLKLWKGQYTKIGHIQSLQSAISELMQYGVEPADLDVAIEKTDSDMLKVKLTDLGIIYRGFKEYIADRYITDEEISDILVKKLPDSKKLCGSTVVLCGFTGLTPVQYRLLEIIMQQADEVIIEITMGDAEDPYAAYNTDDLFAMSKTMVQKTIDIGSRAGTCEEGTVRLTDRPYPRYKSAEELDEFEKHFLRYDGIRIPKQKTSGCVRVISAITSSEEIDAIASEIHRMVMKEGYRYRDIAIISGDIHEYENIIRSVFDSKKIPYYIDSNIAIEANPLPELIKALLNCVSDNYSHEAISRLCECGLIEDDKRISAYMLNYMLQLGLGGYKRMILDWDYIPKEYADIDMKELISYRDALMAIVEPIRACYTGGKAKVRDITRAITGILSELHIREKMQDIAMRLHDVDGQLASREYDRIYDEVESLLTRIDGLLGDEIIGKEEYEQLLGSGLSEISIGMIPACVDTVVVGDLTRTRLDDVKALILIGAVDGVIPKTKDSGYILSDRDKTLLTELDIDLAPTAREDIFIQRYYLYRMLTMASESLTLSYSSMDNLGASRKPSGIIKQINNIYDHPLTVISAADVIDIYTDDDARKYITDIMRDRRYEETLGDKESYVRSIIGTMRQDDKLSHQIDEIIEAVTYRYTDSGIGREAALRLFGESIKGSTTRLETYAQCPFEHFAKYGLGLRERPEFSIERSDVGSLLHSVLQKLFSSLKEEKKSITDMRADELREHTRKCMKEALMDDEADRYTYNAKNRYISQQLECLIDGAVHILTLQLAKGDFTPAYFELPFASSDGLAALDIPATGGGKVELRGVIDRVDLYQEDTKTYVKIIDYKTGTRKWEKYGLIAGTQLQLAIYMDAVMELMEKRYKSAKIVPAAMLYNKIDSPIIEVSGAMHTEDVESKLLDKLRPSGLVCSNSDVLSHLDRDRAAKYKSPVIPVKFDASSGVDFRYSSVATESQMDDIRDYVRHTIANIGGQILSGDVRVSPTRESDDHNACKYCSYRQVCGFDSKIRGYDFRDIVKIKDADAWKIISGGEEGEQS